MRVRLTKISVRSNNDNPVVKSHDVDSDVLRVGRHVGSEIRLDDLSVGLRHAEISFRSGRLYVAPVGGSPIWLEGARVDGELTLEVGQTLQIGAYKLKAELPGSGYDACIEYENTEGKGTELTDLFSRSRLGIEGGFLSARSWTYTLGAAVLIIGVLPLMGVIEGFWSTGPMSNGHAEIAADCQECHTPFRPVQNEQCVTCHSNVPSHVGVAAQFPGIDDSRCAGCHIEHRGAHGLSALQDATCADCHAALPETHETSLPPASDFALDHPEFRLHLSTPEGDVERVVWDGTAGVQEDPAFRFSHYGHVGGVRCGNGVETNLRCDSCHVLDESGLGMEPIEYENHCRSCHPLSWDRNLKVDWQPEEPRLRECQPREALLGGSAETESRKERPVRAFHGEPAEVRRQIRAMYVDDVLRNQPAISEVEREDLVLRLMRPGRGATDEERTWIQEIDDKTHQGFSLLMGDGYCGKCHVLEPSGSDVKEDIVRINITRNWFGSTRFSHAAHGSRRCAHCHARASLHNEEYMRDNDIESALGTNGESSPFGPPARTRSSGLSPSKSAKDVLIPDRIVCLECHGGEEASPPKVASPCVTCHRYHQPGQDAIAARAGRRHATVFQPQENSPLPADARVD